MNRYVRYGVMGHFVVIAGCAVADKPDSFTFTADLPPDFYYKATAVYVPAQGETCRVQGGKRTKVQFNRNWRKESQPTADVKLYRTVSGCPLVLRRVEVDIYGTYSDSINDFGADYGKVAVSYTLPEDHKGTFNDNGESAFYARCQWLFRTVGPQRYITKILDCKYTDAQGTLTRWRPFAAYTLDQLPGKTVRLNVKLADEERPYMGDTWVKVPGGWKRCLGDGLEDQYGFCFGNYKDFSTFRMSDDRVCTIYPGCTENKEVTP
ncbi:hypothetical protein ACW9H6_02860 [Pseudomonas sp. SDO528_S397]